MTSTALRRPVRLSAPAPGPLRTGALAAARAVLLGLVCAALPVLLVWAADSRSGAGAWDAVRAAAQVWLVAHGTTVELQGGRLSLTPLGLVLLPTVMLLRAGAAAAREAAPADLPSAARLVAALAGTYAVLVTAVAGLVGTPASRPLPLAAALCAATLAAGAGGIGVLRAADQLGAARAAVPSGVRRLAAPVAAAVALLLGAGAVLAAGTLAVNVADAAELSRLTAPGRVGGLALLVLSLSLVPVAAVWGTAWLAGPGFAVGLGTTAGPFAHSLGAVPAVPLLAGLPTGAMPGWTGLLVLLLPVGAGVLAGRLLPEPGRLRDAGALGLGCGALLAVMTLAASGSVGSGRLSAVGPSAWQVGAAIAAEVALGASLVLAVRRRRERRATA